VNRRGGTTLRAYVASAHETPPQKYRTTNWKAYNAALKPRGSLLIWLNPVTNWQGDATSKRRRNPHFNNEAI
jgi:hypothetical protein